MSQLSIFDIDFSQSQTEEAQPVSPIITKNRSEKNKFTPKSSRDFQKEFIQKFNQTARYHSRFEVFRDFIHVASISLENSVKQSPELEQQYFKIIARYEKKDLYRFSTLLGLIIAALGHQANDFLGGVFMALELGEGHGDNFLPRLK